jgi:hypothetical protein
MDATHASNATSAVSAANASQLGGSPPSAFQSRVTSSCPASSGIQQVNADGSIGCGQVQFYSGRVVTALNPGILTFLTVPGIAHAIVLNCQAGNANAELVNDSSADLWYSGDTAYIGSWFAANTPFAPTSGETFHLGLGSGSGSKVITITVSTEATGSNCVFQGFAEVMTS